MLHHHELSDVLQIDAKRIVRGNSNDHGTPVPKVQYFAAIKTAVSVIPFASFAAVFPVQGAITRASNSFFFGPTGSAP